MTGSIAHPRFLYQLIIFADLQTEYMIIYDKVELWTNVCAGSFSIKHRKRIQFFHNSSEHSARSAGHHLPFHLLHVHQFRSNRVKLVHKHTTFKVTMNVYICCKITLIAYHPWSASVPTTTCNHRSRFIIAPPLIVTFPRVELSLQQIQKWTQDWVFVGLTVQRPDLNSPEH